MRLLQMSISAAILIACILALRPRALRPLPRRIIVLLWDIVLVRLLIPFSFPGLGIGSAGASGSVAVIMLASVPGANDRGPDMWLCIWCVGACIAALYVVIACAREHKALREALPLSTAEQAQLLALLPSRSAGCRILVSDRISTPVAMGVFRRRILLPRGFRSWDVRSLTCVLAHESSHLASGDNLRKAFAAAAVCLHWFNPLVWLMRSVVERDLEFACDERAVRILGVQSRTAYAHSLLDLTEERQRLFSCAAGFGSGATKRRVVEIMRPRKVSAATVAAAVLVLCAASSVFAVTLAPENAVRTEAVPSSAVQIRAEVPGYHVLEEEITIDTESGEVSNADGKVLGYIVHGDGVMFGWAEEGQPAVNVTVKPAGTTQSGAVLYSVTGA